MTDLFSNGDSGIDESKALVALSQVQQLGNARVRALLSVFRSASSIFSAPFDQLKRVEGIGDGLAGSIKTFDGWDEVDRQLDAGREVDAHIVSLVDDRYPELLRHIYDAPSFLWVRGELPQSGRMIAMVGSRKVTRYGRDQARRLARELVKQGFVVVSGLAYGIDAASHEATVNAGGRAVAVLGSGIDWIYPSKNVPLAEGVMQRGAVVSELPPGTKPDAGNFPVRNRIISGMSLGTLVIEAYEKSGSLITAGIALDQNREVFAVPGRPTVESCRGTNALIQRGHAKLVMDADDILDELGALLPQDDETRETDDTSNEQVESHDLSVAESTLMEAIESEPVHVDDLCQETGLSASEVLVHLLELEMKGLVVQQAGRQVVRT